MIGALILIPALSHFLLPSIMDVEAHSASPIDAQSDCTSLESYK